MTDTVTTVDLAEWLLERIAEDEAAARAARAGGWRVEHDRHQFGDGSSCEAWGIKTDQPWEERTSYGQPLVRDSVVEIGYDRDYQTPEAAFDHAPTAAHVARWDPSRVLAECEAKRRIITALSWDDDPWRRTRDHLLSLLALPYADRPGYQETWRP